MPQAAPTGWDRCQAHGRRCVLGTAAFGVLGLIGWSVGSPRLTSWHRDYVPMSPLTAAGFLCISLLLWRTEAPGFDPRSLIRRLVKPVALLFGAGGLCAAFTNVFASGPFPSDIESGAGSIRRWIIDLSPLSGI